MEFIAPNKNRTRYSLLMFRFKLQGGLARKEQGLWLMIIGCKYVTLYLYSAISQDFRVKSSDRPPPYSYQFILLNLLSVNVPQSSLFQLRGLNVFFCGVYSFNDDIEEFVPVRRFEAT